MTGVPARMSQFQSTLPHGERRNCRRKGGVMSKISIHAPARGATKISGLRNLHFRFQSTLPHGERLFLWYITFPLSNFNPRSRTGSDSVTLISMSFSKGFQSTLPHGERQMGNFDKQKYDNISIHAPARGATYERR